MKYGWVRSMFTIFLSPCPLRRSISTVDRFFLVWGHIDGWYRPIFFWYESTATFDFDRFLGEIDGRSNIASIFKLVNPYRPSISTVFSSRWILIDRRYRPYSEVGESLSTVDIDRDRSTGQLKSNRPIHDTLCKFFKKGVCVCCFVFIKPILGNRYGPGVNSLRVCVALFYYTDIGESLRSRGQFLTAVDLGWPDPHPSP